MKSVLISIRPELVEKIVSGKKTIEVRKTKPSIPTPFKAYIYCCKSKSQGRYRGYEGAYENSEGEIVFAQQHVIGKFICDKVYPIKYQGNRYSVADEEQSVTNEIARQSCLDYDDMVSYLGNKDGYGWHISQLKIYDKPKELKDFLLPCGGKICWGCNLLNVKESDCINRGKRYATLPPQSWCYVQEEDDPNVF